MSELYLMDALRKMATANHPAINTDTSELLQKEAESRYYEQIDSMNHSHNMYQICIQIEDLEKRMHKLERDIKQADKTEKKVEGLFVQFNKLSKKISQFEHAQDKTCHQLKHMKKIILCLGTAARINKPSDTLKKAAANFENYMFTASHPEYIKKKNCIDIPYKEL